jgi:predicted GIY-YIG superfamily endonuclease
MRNHDYWVYILANKGCTTLYIGLTNNMSRRLYQHRYGEVNGFTKRYHFESTRLARALSQRERRDCLRKATQGLAAQPENCTY